MFEYNLPEQPTGERYKARAEADFNWSNEKTIRLEISVGQPYHEGPKLEAAISWADKNFSKKVILLGDSLQRYNLMMAGMSATQARIEALQSGDAWLERHKDIIQGIEVLRWDHVLSHPDFLSIRWKIGRLYRDNQTIRSMVDKTIGEIAIRRKIGKDESIRFFDLSLQYVLEEAAGTAIESNLYPGVSAYPGTIPKFWTALAGAPSFMTPKGLENSNCIRIRLKKR